MISLFYKIRQELLTQNRVIRYLVYVFAEIFLLVIGTLIAFKGWTSLTLGLLKEGFSDLDFVKTYSPKSVIIENPDTPEFLIDGEIREHRESVYIKLKMRLEVYTNLPI